jgi:hypothetical protein
MALEKDKCRSPFFVAWPSSFRKIAVTPKTCDKKRKADLWCPYTTLQINQVAGVGYTS